MDQGKKTMRHFYCRDVLWDTFEQMANDFDCSIDYLVNEAMRYYARSKNYPSSMAGSQSGAGQGQAASSAGLATQPPDAFMERSGPQGGSFGQTGHPPGRRTIPPIPAGGATIESPTLSPSAGRRTGPVPTGAPTWRPQNSGAPVTSSSGGNLGQSSVGARPSEGAGGQGLYLVFNNQKILIDKDQFIIGRGSKTSDLAIKDGNISRKHAAVIRRNGTFYIKDLGSTNGIDFKGTRIDNKRIDEGDVFHLCDYELRFTYFG